MYHWCRWLQRVNISLSTLVNVPGSGTMMTMSSPVLRAFSVSPWRVRDTRSKPHVPCRSKMPLEDSSGRFELTTLLQRSGPRLALQNGPVFTILHCIDFRIYYTLRGISIKLFWIFLCKNLMNPSQKCSFRKCLADFLATFFVRLGKNTSKTSLNTDSSNSYLALRENNIKLF